MKYTFIMLLMAHILCDFYFQTEQMAIRKQKNFEWVILHSLLYMIIAAISFAVVILGLPWKYPLIFSISHAMIDIAKYAFLNFTLTKYPSCFPAKLDIFVADQVMHLLFLLTITYSLRNYTAADLYNPVIRDILDEFGMSGSLLSVWCIKFLLIHKPANILIANILDQYKPDAKTSQNSNDKKTGRLIGTLERIIMTIFISLGQYSAVGLVLTAKSIARFDKISKDQAFAEYYLLGTLISSICAISVSIVF